MGVAPNLVPWLHYIALDPAQCTGVDIVLLFRPSIQWLLQL